MMSLFRRYLKSFLQLQNLDLIKAVLRAQLNQSASDLFEGRILG
jgi:hypothetical protein